MIAVIELVLTEGHIVARQTSRDGLVSKVFPTNTLVDKEVKMPNVIVSKGLASVIMAKEVMKTNNGRRVIFPKTLPS